MIKTDFRNMSESLKFRGKNRAKPYHMPNLPLFHKKRMHLLKNRKYESIFYCKNKCTFKLYVFMIKSALENMSERSDFRFKSTLSTPSTHLKHTLALNTPSSYICI